MRFASTHIFSFGLLAAVLVACAGSEEAAPPAPISDEAGTTTVVPEVDAGKPPPPPSCEKEEKKCKVDSDCQKACEDIPDGVWCCDKGSSATSTCFKQAGDKCPLPPSPDAGPGDPMPY